MKLDCRARTKLQMKNFYTFTFLAPLLLGVALLAAGCTAIAGHTSTGVVVSRSAQIRSSTAVVAADLFEVKRGDTIDIIDSLDVPDPSDNSKKERWFRVRARNEENTEGWIEARNIMPDDVLAKSTKLADEDKDLQPQATGQLHAGSNLRLSPDRSNNENIMMRLDSGSSFEIIGWKRLAKRRIRSYSCSVSTQMAEKSDVTWSRRIRSTTFRS